jgi:glycosyltransferase involved in cell wall biosynthesis
MSPNPDYYIFDEKRYLKTYPDVIRAIILRICKNGYHHYLLYGKKEGRQDFWCEKWIPVQSGSFQRKRIIFVIPCYNNVSYTEQTVKSIIENSYDPFFVFVDNGSTDETKNYLGTVPNSQVVYNPQNYYVTKAWNQGLSLAQKIKGDYVCLCNNDIIAGKQWINSILYLFQNRENEFYYPANNNPPYTAFDTLDEFNDYYHIIKRQPLKIAYLENYFIGFCIFLKKEYLSLFLPIPEDLKIHHGDDYIVNKLRENNIVPAKVNKCYTYHFLQTTQKIVPLIDDYRKQDDLIWTEKYR